MSDEKGKDLVVFLDTIGRTIIGERTSETEEHVSVKNPAVVNIVPQQAQDPNTGQTVQRMALQLFPVFFKEFLADKEEDVVFAYNKKNISLSESDIVLDFKVNIQYEQMFANVGMVAPSPAPAPASAPEETEDNVIKLFDD